MDEQIHEETILIALDLGNEQIKIKTKNNELIFPAAILDIEDTNMEFIIPSNDIFPVFKTAINENKGHYFGPTLTDIGYEEMWIRSTGYGIRRYNNETFMSMLTYALGLAVSEYGEGSYEVDIVIGLPVSEAGDSQSLDDTEAKRSICEYLSNTQNVTINEEKYQIDINKIKTVPQYFGTIVNLIDEEKTNKKEELLKGESEIIDLGGGTTVGATIKRFSFGRKSFNESWGVIDVIDRIRSQTGVDSNTLMNIFKSNRKDKKYVYELRGGKQTQDLTSIINQARKYYTNHILNKMRSEIRQPEKLTAIYITGGGANIILEDKIKKEFPEVQIVPESEMANVRGFYKLGKIFNVLEERKETQVKEEKTN